MYVEEWKKKGLVPKVDFVDRKPYPFYYSFKHKGVLFLMMDGAKTRIGADQVKWIERQLAAGRRMKLRFAVSHIPLSKFITKDHGVLSPKDKLYDTFAKGRLSAFFTGHYHVYYKGRYKKLTVVSTGLLGTGNRTLIGDSKRQPDSFIVVDVVKGKMARCFALTGPDFKTIFDDATLPAEVGEHRR